jgi:hypothetical protein
MLCEAIEESEVEILHFHISGESVTNLARDWLYAENRPFEKVMNFLLSCMHGTDMSTEELTSLAHDVLLGKRKFIGTTRDDSFCMVEDDADMIELYPNAFKYRDDYEYRVGERVKGKMTIPETIYDSAWREERRKAFGKPLWLKKRACINENEDEDCDDEPSYSYGWLSPEGKFYEVNWGHHPGWAMEYVNEHFPDVDDSSLFFHHDDFLRKQGWILLHDPSGRGVIIEEGDRPKTKQQKEFLYDYFMKRGDESEANELWEKEEEGL